MKYIRDFALVVGGALAALSLQPTVSIGSGDALAPIADKLVAIAEVINIDKRKNVTISSPGKLSLLAGSNLLIQSKDILSLLGSRAEFRGTKIVQVGGGGVADVIKVDGGGNATISSPRRISLSATQITLKGRASTNVSGGTKLSLTADGIAELRGGTTMIGRGGKPAVTYETKVICSAPGVPCQILPTPGTVLIGR